MVVFFNLIVSSISVFLHLRVSASLFYF